MNKIKTIKEQLEMANPEAILFDELDSALVGYGQVWSQDIVAVYSANKILKALMKNNKWDYEQAMEWYDYNIGCLYAGKGTPFIIQDQDDAF